jgi:hypothetical protein
VADGPLLVGTPMIARTTILLAFLFLCFLHYQAAGPLARGVDSYPCIQAETNRAPNPGCRSSRKELPSDSS